MTTPGGKTLLPDAAVVPPTPASGGVLYSTGGALHWLGSSGTDTVVTAQAVALVFQPGGTAKDNVYITEASLATATQAFNGAPYTIFWDLTYNGGSTYTPTTVGAWDLAPEGTWTDGGAGITIDFANGTTLTDHPNLEGAITVFQDQTQTIITQAAAQATRYIRGSCFVEPAAFNPTGYFFDNNGNGLTLLLQDRAYVNGSPGSGPPALYYSHGSSSISVIVEDNASFFDDGSGAAVVTIISPAGVAQNQPNTPNFDGIFVTTSSVASFPSASTNHGKFALGVGGLFVGSTTLGWVSANSVSITFKPGLVGEEGNVITNEADLALITQTLQGAPYTIFWDLSHHGSSTYTPTTVGVWNLAENGTWTDGGVGITIEFSNGTTLPDHPNLEGAITVEQHQTATVITASASSVRYIKDSCSIGQVGITALGTWFNNNGHTFTLHVTGTASLGKSSNGPVTFNYSGSGAISIYMEDASRMTGSSTAMSNGATFYAVGPSCSITEANFPHVIVVGLYNDVSGDGPPVIPAASSDGQYMLSLGMLYQSNGTSWVAAATTTFVFQPGGDNEGIIFTDETNLANVTQALQGAPYTILWDLSLVSGYYTPTTVGMWNLAPNGTWTDGGAGYNVDFTNETTLPDLPNLDGAIDITLDQNTTVITLTNSTYSIRRYMAGLSYVENYGSPPECSWVDSNGNVCGLDMRDEATVLANGTPPIFVNSGGGSGVLVTLFDRSTFSEQTTTGATLIVASPAANFSSGITSAEVAGLAVVNVTEPGAGLSATRSAGALISNLGQIYFANHANGWVSTNGVAFVFRPGGASEGGNIFDAEADLAAATQTLSGAPYTILFDLSHVSGTYSFTTVGALNFGAGGTWTDAGLGYTVKFANGTTIPNLPDLKGALTVDVAQTTTVATISTAAIFHIKEKAQITQSASDAGYVNGTSGTVTCYVSDSGATSGSATGTAKLFTKVAVVVEDNGSVGAYSVDSTSTVLVVSPGAFIDPSVPTIAAVTYAPGVTISGALATPNGTITASPGALYVTSNGGSGTTLWVKESGVGTNTGWVGK